MALNHDFLDELNEFEGSYIPEKYSRLENLWESRHLWSFSYALHSCNGPSVFVESVLDF